jgi:hypothetical protein
MKHLVSSILSVSLLLPFPAFAEIKTITHTILKVAQISKKPVD